MDGVQVGFALGDLGEEMVSFAFLVKGLLENIHGGGVAKALGERTNSAIAGHFVMLDALSGADEASIANAVIAISLDHQFAFLDEAFHGLAGFATGLLAERLEYLLEAADVSFGLPEVRGEGVLELLVGSGFGHFRQGLDELSFRAEEVTQFLDVQVAQ